MTRDDMLIYMEQHLIELRGYQDDNAEIVDILLYAIEEAGMVPVKDLSKESKFLENTYKLLKGEGVFDWDLDQDLLDMIEEDKETVKEVKKIEDRLRENKSNRFKCRRCDTEYQSMMNASMCCKEHS